MWKAGGLSLETSSAKLCGLLFSFFSLLPLPRQKRRGTFSLLHNVALIYMPPLCQARSTLCSRRYQVSGRWRFRSFANGSANMKAVPSLTRKPGKKRARTHGSFCIPLEPLVRRRPLLRGVGFLMLMEVAGSPRPIVYTNWMMTTVDAAALMPDAEEYMSDPLQGACFYTYAPMSHVSGSSFGICSSDYVFMIVCRNHGCTPIPHTPERYDGRCAAGSDDCW